MKIKSGKGSSYALPLVLVTSLFFMWGFAISMLDVLNKHFQEVLRVSKGESGLIQLTVYGAYFIMALPAGYFIKRYGYQKGILLGLFLYAAGAFLFYPAVDVQTFGFFLFALFVIGCGLAIIETAANPYISVLGKPEGAARRLNLAQSFNGLGVILGPLIGGLVFFVGDVHDSAAIEMIKQPYLVIGTIVLLLLIVFSVVKLPEAGIADEEIVHVVTHPGKCIAKGLWQYKHFVFGVIAQFFYIGAQAGVWGFFINYSTEVVHGMTNQQASFFLSGAMILYTAGRFASTLFMRFIRPEKLLLIYALLAMAAVLIVLLQWGMVSVYALMLSCYCMSTMFPTIFTLGIAGLGNHTKQGGSVMIMSIVGGAVIPPVMGLIADSWNTTTAFLLPWLCFLVVGLYAFNYQRSFRSI